MIPHRESGIQDPASSIRIDSHQHFWVYDPGQYPWIPKDSPLQRNWLPSDLEPLLARTGLQGSIAVQARQTIEESHWLLTLADHAPIVRGVVGWVDLRSDKVEEQLTGFAKHPKFVGVRHIAQDEPDDRFLLRPDFLRGIGKLKAFKMTYDILIYPRQLPAAIELVRRFPDQPFVLDHIAKPLIKDRTLSPWREQIRDLARSENVLCKVSGMITEASRADWKAADFRPYLDVVFAAFGGDRLMYGSDWPVCLMAGSYEKVFELVDEYCRALDGAVRDRFFGGNAARFYGVPRTGPER